MVTMFELQMSIIMRKDPEGIASFGWQNTYFLAIISTISALPPPPLKKSGSAPASNIGIHMRLNIYSVLSLPICV